MMDLGATLCTRTKPNCPACPVAKTCVAHAQGNPTDYPGKKPKKAKPVKALAFLILRDTKGRVLLEQRPSQGIWGGLWSLPEQTPEDFSNYGPKLGGMALAKYVSERQPLAGFRHTFSHYHLDIQPWLLNVTRKPAGVGEDAPREWFTAQEWPHLGLAAPVVKLLEQPQLEQSLPLFEY
jgi:A/G-specific adenine glycosylase